MADEDREMMNDRHRRVPYTLRLTEALEAGDITPGEYVRQRAILVGEGDILQTLIIPLLRQIIMRIRNLLSS
jgi:hypothetical protein